MNSMDKHSNLFEMKGWHMDGEDRGCCHYSPCVLLGGVMVPPGDIVAADGDGMNVVPPGNIDPAAEIAWEIL